MKRIIITIALTLVVTFGYSQSVSVTEKKDSVVATSNNTNISTIKDKRDGRIYKTVKIGTQTWFAENLNYYTGSGSWCYNNDINICNEYGRLYDWETARKACPKGWHLPSDEDWNLLIKYVGSEEGTKLKATRNWETGIDGTDIVSFAALPGGYRSFNNLTFNYIGSYGFWWSLNDSDIYGAWSQYLCFDQNYMYRLSNNKKDGFSVRCIMDN